MAVVTLTPPTLDLYGIRAGDRNLMTVTLTRSGTPIDLTGQQVKAQARKVASDIDPPALTATITITNAAGGVFTMEWDGDAVRTLLGTEVSWTGVWDLQYGPSGGKPLTIAAGAFRADMDVTR